MKQVIVTFEVNTSGEYWGVTTNIPGVVTSCGATFEELRNNMVQAYQDHRDLLEELGDKALLETPNNPYFEFKTN